MPDLHAGFRRPDADARTDGLFAFLERVDGLPHVQAIKRRMADLLGPRAGLALARARWELVGTASDGSPVHLTGNGTIVSRRRPDGTWGVVLDDPLGASHEPADVTAAGPTGSGIG
jgi:hypothetical protein